MAASDRHVDRQAEYLEMTIGVDATDFEGEIVSHQASLNRTSLAKVSIGSEETRNTLRYSLNLQT